MARSDLLELLFPAYSRSDDSEFRAVAARIVADERLKQRRYLLLEG